MLPECAVEGVEQVAATREVAHGADFGVEDLGRGERGYDRLLIVALRFSSSIGSPKRQTPIIVFLTISEQCQFD
jgi:hypothetical protein